MARDEAIAIAFSEGKVPPTLRLYQWSAPSFSIGAFQRLDPNWLARFENPREQDAIVLVRRVTGGRGLLHDREMTYAVIAGTEDPLFSGGIKETFYAIATGLLAGLETLGVVASVHRPSKKKQGSQSKDPLCFSSTSWYEIVVGDKKLIGSAQRRWRRHFLQQGSLMTEKSQIALHDNEALNLSFVSEHQVTLSELLPALPSQAQAAEALKSGFEKALGLHFISARPTAYELALVERLVTEKYGNPDWNRDRQSRTESPAHLGRDAQKSL